MQSNPTISILMSVHNSESFLADTMNSIIRQNFENYELIAIDDNSTDNSKEILHEYAKVDSRICIISQDIRLGLTQSLNKGLAKARGAFIARQDADDLSAPDRLTCQYNFLKKHLDYGLVGTAVIRIDCNGKEIAYPLVIRGDKRIRRFLKGGNVFAHGSVMMRREAIEAVGGYRLGFRYAQDYDLWLRISAISKLENLSSRLYYWRAHSGGISEDKIYDQVRYAAIAAFISDERKRDNKDLYLKLEEAGGDIDVFLNITDLKKKIDPIISRIYFRMGKRELACRFLSDTKGLYNNILYKICKNESLFRRARKMARFIISLSER